MGDMRIRLLEFLEKMVNSLIYSPPYNSNINLFITNNGNLNSFVANHSQIITNPDLRKALLTYLNDQDYQNIINKIHNTINSSQNQITVDKIIPTHNENEEFKDLTEINRPTLSEEDQLLYDKAIHIAMDYNGNHNIKIGYKEGHIIPIIQDEMGNITNLNDIEDPSNVEKISSHGFSDSLILAFIIGSVIGIIFLNIYSKFMK